MDEYERRVDAWGREWLAEHPERLEAAQRLYGPIDTTKPIALYQHFDEGTVWSEVTYDYGKFDIGLLVQLVAGGTCEIAVQYGSADIDFAAILRALLAVELPPESPDA